MAELTTLWELFNLYNNNGFTELANRVADFRDRSKPDQIAGLEELIHDCKKKVVPCDYPCLAVMKHVYRQLTQ